MAIAHKETVSTSQGVSSTWTVNNISSPASGDLLILVATSDSPHTVNTNPSGFTLYATQNDGTGTDSSTSVWWKVAGASEASTYDVVFASNELGISAVSAFTGVDSTTPNDVTFASESSTSSTAKTMPSVTPVTTGAVVIGLFGVDPTAAHTTTWDAPATELLDAVNGTSGYLTIASEDWSGSGAVAMTATLSASKPAAEFSIVLRPAAAASSASYPLQRRSNAHLLSR